MSMSNLPASKPRGGPQTYMQPLGYRFHLCPLSTLHWLLLFLFFYYPMPLLALVGFTKVCAICLLSLAPVP